MYYVSYQIRNYNKNKNYDYLTAHLSKKSCEKMWEY